MRFLTYSHDSCGLGHLRRTFVISRHLAEYLPDSMVLSVIGSTAGPYFFSPESRNHDYIKLPCVQKFGADDYRARHLPLTFDEFINLRRSIITQSLSVFAPDIVIVDKNPQGLGGELIPALESLRSNRPGARIILGLRDILDDPRIVAPEWQDRALVDWIDRIYDAVWVWGEPEVFDAAEAYQFPSAIRRKTKYLGYLPPNQTHGDDLRLRRKAGIASPDERLAVMTFGGGGDALPKALLALRGLERAAEPRVRALVVTGPLMNDEDFHQTQAQARSIGPRVRVLRFVPNLDDWLRAADAVVCMGGYNTLCEVAAIGKPALVLPRTEPRREQSLRASRFGSRGWCECLEEGQDGEQALVDFFQRLAGDRLAPSLAPLVCRGLRSLLDEVSLWTSSPNGAAPVSLNARPVDR